MRACSLRLTNPLLCLVVLIALTVADSPAALSQNVLMVQDTPEATSENLKKKKVELHQLETEMHRQEQVFAVQALMNARKLNGPLLTLEDQSENEIDRSLVSDFWIGVQVEKAGSTIFSPKEAPDAELNIDGGLRILAVTESSAADEAGIEEGDVLLKFANKQMNSMNDLFAVVGETEDNEAELVLIRGGELISLQITPQPRPEKSEGNQQPSGVAGLWTIEEAYRNELMVKQLPEGYQLKIELVRGEDVTFEVKKGNDTWRANGGAIYELPELIQPIAEKLAEHCEPLVEEKQHLVWHAQLQNQWSFQPQNTNDGRLEAIERQLAELTKAIQKLKSNHDN